MGNVFSQLIHFFSGNKVAPVYVSNPPQRPPYQPEPLTPASADTQHSLNWSHPFKDKSNPLLQLTQMAKAVAGYYPLGRSGLWHYGVHFDSGTAGTQDQSSVRCLADGEVVAYRFDEHSPTTIYSNAPLKKKSPSLAILCWCATVFTLPKSRAVMTYRRL